MTPKQIMTIDLREIAAVEIRCANCEAMFSFPPAEKILQFADCLGCNKRLWDSEEDRRFLVVRALSRMLRSWGELDPALRTFSITFSIEIPTAKQSAPQI